MSTRRRHQVVQEESDYEEDSRDEGADSEDTEDASETDNVKQEDEVMEIKEQMYHDKLGSLKKQLQQLNDGIHPEYTKKLRRLEQQYRERLRSLELWQQYETDLVEREYIKEKKAAVRDCEEKKVELRDSLIQDLEEKKRIIEVERYAMELTGDSMEVKPVSTRKLRRRPNEPVPVPEKRRKTAPQSLNYLLEEDQINEDMKQITKLLEGEKEPEKKAPPPAPAPPPPPDIRIEDGKLFYEKKWFHRGQPIFVEGKEVTKYSAVIAQITPDAISVRKISDNSKVKILLLQLQKGKYQLRRRPS